MTSILLCFVVTTLTAVKEFTIWWKINKHNQRQSHKVGKRPQSKYLKNVRWTQMMVSMFWRREKIIEKESYLNNSAHRADTGQRAPWMGRLCVLKQRDAKGLPRLFRIYLWTRIPLFCFYNTIPAGCAGFHQQWTTEGTEKERGDVWSSFTLPS